MAAKPLERRVKSPKPAALGASKAAPVAEKAKVSTPRKAAKPTTAPGVQRTCLLVLGVHRSGTSALTRVLSILGAALPKRLMGGGEGNETGHWEGARIVQYHDQSVPYSAIN